MPTVRYACDCDAVIAMEELGIGIEEILQYARAILPRDEVRQVIRGLEEILESPEPVDPTSTGR